jgi:hypothetical protein
VSGRVDAITNFFAPADSTTTTNSSTPVNPGATTTSTTPINSDATTNSTAPVNPGATPITPVTATTSDPKPQKNRSEFRDRKRHKPNLFPREDEVTLAERFGIRPDHRTRNLNKWIKALEKGLRLRPGAIEEYTPSKGTAKHVLDLDPFPNKLNVNRDFRLTVDLPYLKKVTRVLEVEERPVQRTVVPLKTTEVMVWLMPIRDFADPQSPTIMPFTLEPRGKKGTTGKHPFPFDGLLEEAFCDDALDAKALAHILCRVLNNTPVDLELEQWSTVRRQTLAGGTLSLVNRFAEIAALVAWRPDFDFEKLPSGQTGWLQIERQVRGGAKKMTAAAYSTALNPYDKHGTKKRLTCEPPMVFLKTSANSAHTQTFGFSIEPSGYKSDMISQLGDYPGFWFGGQPAAPDATDNPILSNQVAHKLARHITFSLVGMVGTERQLVELVDDIKRQCIIRTDSISAPKKSGPYNNGSIMHRPKPHNPTSVWLHFPHNVRKNLVYGDGTAVESENNDTNHVDIYLNSKNRINMAYIKQAMVNRLAHGGTILDAIEDAHVAAEVVDLGLVTTDEIKASYCPCQTDEERAKTEHVCMHCQQLYLCCDTTVDTENRVLCKAVCSTEPDTLHDVTYMGLEGLIRFRARALYTGELKHYSPDWSSDDVSQAINTLYAIKDEDAFMDGYNGIETLVRASYSNVATRHGFGGCRGLSHPLQLSFDKPFPMWATPVGNAYLHHPEYNLVATRLCTNFLAGDDPKCLLPWLKKIFLLFESISGQPPVRGYHPEVAEVFETFEKFANNLRKIKGFMPRSNADRLRVAKEPRLKEDFAKIIRQYTTGVWEGDVPYDGGQYSTRGLFWMNAKGVELSFKLEYTKEMLRQIQQSPIFNPHGLIMPTNKDGSPWVWQEAMKADADIKFLDCEFTGRLKTWNEECDAHHETVESPLTLAIEYMVQWFETGGKCPFFGFIMVPVARHPAAYSFGRGLFAVTLENGMLRRGRRIAAGEILRTGCRVLMPTDMARDYDHSRRTVLVQSWKFNALLSNFSNDPQTHEYLREVVRTFADSTRWYDAPKARHEYRDVQHPTHWPSGIIRGYVVEPDEELAMFNAVRAAMETAALDSFDVMDDADDESDEDEDFIPTSRSAIIERAINLNAIVNPNVVINGLGHYAWADGTDRLSAIGMGLRTPYDVVLARQHQTIPLAGNADRRPTVIFYPNRQYLNPPGPDIPTEHGRWQFLSSAVEELAEVNYGGNEEYQFGQRPTAEEIWQTRVYENDRNPGGQWGQEIDIVWIPESEIASQSRERDPLSDSTERVIKVDVAAEDQTAPPPPFEPTRLTDYNVLTVTKLKVELKSRGISNRGLILKADIVAALEQNDLERSTTPMLSQEAQDADEAGDEDGDITMTDGDGGHASSLSPFVPSSSDYGSEGIDLVDLFKTTTDIEKADTTNSGAQSRPSDPAAAVTTTAQQASSDFGSDIDDDLLDHFDALDRANPAVSRPAIDTSSPHHPSEPQSASSRREIDVSIGAHLLRRLVFGPETAVDNAVTNHRDPAYGIMVAVGIYPDDRLAFATTDRKFCTIDGEEVASYNAQGEVYSKNNVFLGSIMPGQVDGGRT